MDLDLLYQEVDVVENHVLLSLEGRGAKAGCQQLADLLVDDRVDLGADRAANVCLLVKGAGLGEELGWLMLTWP